MERSSEQPWFGFQWKFCSVRTSQHENYVDVRLVPPWESTILSVTTFTIAQEVLLLPSYIEPKIP